MKSMWISIRLYSLQYVHTSHITGITIYCIHTRLTLPPPPPNFISLTSLVMCESKSCLSEFFKFLLHHIHILWFKKNERLKLLRIYYLFFFRKILSWIICYTCVCCNVKQYICAWIFIRTLYSWNMYVCHSNAKYSHYINVRLFFCIFSWTIFLCVYYY